MTRLIDGDALEKAIYEWMPKDQEKWMDSKIPPIENLVVSIMMTIQEQQPVDAEPVRHGHWVGIDDEPYEVWECDMCGYIYETDSKLHRYCPNCGADMRGEKE